MDPLQISFFGPANSGKSTLVNAICGQEVSIVSNVPGTTTDPVRKRIELPYGIGPAVVVDTAGIDDASILGPERRRRTAAVIDTTDIAVVLDTGDGVSDGLVETLRSADIPVVLYEAKGGESVDSLLQRIAAVRPKEEDKYMTGNLVHPGSQVVLVMPQDSEAPKGRIILPQVQVLRELLDRGCIPHCCTPETLPAALAGLAALPDLVITDSQAFAAVNRMLPADCPLTSFSILLAAAKGDIKAFVDGAEAIDRLSEADCVLIAVACTHVPDTEDIGRVKIPALLRKRAGDGLRVMIAAGNDFPDDLSPFALIIHCGACVASRALVRARTRKALHAGVPMTNYGIALAKLTGILDRVVIPGLGQK